MKALSLTLAILTLATATQSVNAAPPSSTKPGAEQQVPGVVYLNLDELRPGQVRKSDKNVEEKIKSAIIKGGVTQDESGYHPKLNGGTSIFPPKEAIPVVKAHLSYGKGDAKDVYVLIDGHHSALASMATGATTIPVTVKEDLSHLSEAEFWKKAADKKWTHLYTLGGEPVAPPESFNDLQNDPLRTFATITARKCFPRVIDLATEYPGRTFTTKEKQALEESTYDTSFPGGPNNADQYPLWLKVGGKAIPFIEFYIADALHKEGFKYTEGDEKRNFFLFHDQINRARKLLNDNLHKYPKLQGLMLITDDAKWDKLPFIKTQCMSTIKTIKE